MLSYRSVARKYGKVISFKANSLGNIPEEFIKFNNKHFEYSGIDSLMLSLLELSCGKIKVINKPLALSLIDSRILKE
jgi:hypothetical protein